MDEIGKLKLGQIAQKALDLSREYWAQVRQIGIGNMRNLLGEYARYMGDFDIDKPIAKYQSTSTTSHMLWETAPSDASTNSNVPEGLQPDTTKQQQAILASFKS